MESDADSESKGIHPVDLVLMLVSISLAATIVLLDRFAIPAYVKTYQDFGAALPLVTRAVLSHVAPLSLAALTVIVGAAGMVVGARGARSAALGLGLAGIVIGIGSVAFCFYALYAPIFEFAGKINKL
ncbi:MAG TPA: hypothetical protein PK156_24565 [Polyangium sp.]|nr:hypothetical protein [Polyangium sp.]